jgi:hypothetical protein
MIGGHAAKALTLLSGITTLDPADKETWKGFWPGLVTRIVFELDEAGNDEASRMVAGLLAEVYERLVPPMTPQEEYRLAGNRYERALGRAKIVREAGKREEQAAEAEYAAAYKSLSRFEVSPGIPLPEYDPLRQEEGQQPERAECMGTAEHGSHEFNGGMRCPGLGDLAEGG